MGSLKTHLFETNAIKVCKDDSPFWYTSGKIGPYFINTHFVYGDEESATNLLKVIDEIKQDKINLPKIIFDLVLKQYNSNNIYKDVIDEMISFIKLNINIDEIDYISGGERRDWFFSYMASYLLDKPQITIFKDLTTIVSSSNFSETNSISSLSEKKVLHIADLITVASSYIRAWIPAIQNLGAELVCSLALVDRMQGGSKRLEDLGIKSYAMVKIDEDLFNMALQKNIINERQFNMLIDFYHDPDGSMREFLISHPNFIKNALSSDKKTAERAKLCVDGNLYSL
ncbi:MAG: orotate phosphoribosyltransferase [Clostridia bacterium]|jgi:orotate phosphoribosyltransferase|nr:orotate phosphoribosyltransferase [Clostridia bacterium]